MGIRTTPPTPEELKVIEQLSEMIDLVEYQSVIGRKTRFGKRPHRTDPAWGYSKALFATYTEPRPVEEILLLFGRLGATNEIEVARFIGLNMKHIP
jgi:hypothetical protein